MAKQYDSIMDLGTFKMAKRHSFIVNPQGVIAKIYRSVNPSNHVEEILADLRELQSKSKT